MGKKDSTKRHHHENPKQPIYQPRVIYKTLNWLSFRYTVLKCNIPISHGRQLESIIGLQCRLRNPNPKLLMPEKLVRRSGTKSLPSTNAPHDHPYKRHLPLLQRSKTDLNPHLKCGGGGSGGGKALDKLPVPGRPTYLDYSRARAYCACKRCWWGLFGHFFSQLSFLFPFSLSLGDSPI